MTEAFYYPGYVIRLQKERQTQAKFAKKNNARKRCQPNQLYIMVITKNNKIFRMHFLQVTTFISQMTPIIVISWEQKKTKTYKIKGKFTKITKIGFMKTGCSKKKDHLKKKKLLWRANCFWKHKWCEMYIEMLSYKITEIKLADLRSLSLFF